MGHPLRVRLMHLLAVEPGLGAAEIARLIDVPVHTVRRHLRFLVAADLLAVGDAEPRRGVRKLFYVNRRSPVIDEPEDRLLSLDRRRRMAIEALRCLLDDCATAIRSPDFARREGRAVACVPGRVDARGWQELSDLFRRAIFEALEIVEASGERLAREGGEEIRFTSGLVLLDLPPREAPG